MSHAASATEYHSGGEALRANPAVKQGIEQIVAALNEQRVQITGVRGPRSDAARADFETFMAHAGEVRGRPLLYPHVGSGLGNGPFIELMDGSVKMDMITGIGVQFFGHSDPDLTAAALEGATADTVMQGHLMMNREAIDFAGKLLDEAQRSTRMKHAFLCGSGAMANENALKVCYQKHEPASRVIAFAHCFMGRSITMAQIGDSAGGRQGIPLSTLVDYMPFYDHIAARRMSAGDVSGSTRYIDMAVWHLEEYFARYPKQHAAFIFELIQGEGGFNTALPEFHRALMECCKAHGVAVWDDEVQTFGRTKSMFACEALGLGEYIDVISIGKMSQVCAALYTDEYNPKPGLLSGTFLGSAVGLKVGMRILDRLSEGGYYGDDGKIEKHHKLFRTHAQALVDRHPDWFPANHQVHELVSGYGGMVRLTPFGGAKDPILKLCKVAFEEGIILFYCGHGPFHLRMLPPLGVLEESHWATAFEILERSMKRVADEMGPFKSPSVRPLHQSGG